MRLPTGADLFVKWDGLNHTLIHAPPLHDINIAFAVVASIRARGMAKLTLAMWSRAR